MNVPVWEKINLTLEEAAAYSMIGENRLRKIHALTETEQSIFMEYIKNHPIYSHWGFVFTVLLGTGCRVGEVVGLTKDDCDFQNDIISINHSLIYRQDEITHQSKFSITTPKTKAGEREIPMFETVKKMLLGEQEKQCKEGFCKSIIDGYSKFIFLNRYGEVLSPHCINRAIERITQDYNIEESELAERQGRDAVLLPHFSVHNLRHTFCTRICENETNLKIIQEIMGHADITTTMDIYNEATQDKKKQSFANIESKMRLC